MSLQIALGIMVILIILILPVQEHRISIHLFLSSLSLTSVLQFAKYRSSQVGLFLGFVFFYVIVNWIIYLISLSDSLLLVYRSAGNFCTLILVFAILPNSVMSSRSFLVVFLGFSVYNIMSSEKNNTFTSSFPILDPFISFSCLIALAGTLKIMLNKSDESGHPCLVLDLRGDAFCFPLLRVCQLWGLGGNLFFCLEGQSILKLSHLEKACWIDSGEGDKTCLSL